MNSLPSNKTAISLIGMPGSGKSTLAPLLAQELGYEFLDVDDWIIEHTSRDISYLIAEGEPFLFHLQEQCIRETPMDNLVLSTPGSIIYIHYLDILKNDSLVVYLDAPTSVLEQRIKEQANPQRLILGLEDNSFKDLHTQRKPLYEELAHYTLEYKEESPEDSVSRILDLISQG